MNINSLFFRIMPLVLLTLVFAACTGSKGDGEGPLLLETTTGIDTQSNIAVEIERIAEIERAGAFFPGLALAESGLRERIGDFSGAVVAAFKELSWAYGYGTTGKTQVEEGLQNALVLFTDVSQAAGFQRSSAIAALRGCMAFAREDWDQAEELLTGILKADEESDSFLRWMLLVCAMEQDAPGEETAAIRSAYSAIRARYMRFPEYWHRGARAFSSVENVNAGEGNITASYAEQCINASPQGPFAADCRKILTDHLGLSSNGKSIHSDIRTKVEIETTIRAAVSMNNPFILEELFPLMSLPENPYTLYAMGALKALSSAPEYRDFFIDEAHKSSGRLGDRLSYISRG